MPAAALAPSRRRSLLRVPNVFLRSKPTRIDPGDLAHRLLAALAERHPGTSFQVQPRDGEVTVGWEDGPAVATMTEVVAPLANWEVRTAAAPPARAGAPAVIVQRRFSDRALAVAVIRYQGSNVRPYDSAVEPAVTALVSLLEVDEPARSGYPVPDAMAELLLAAPDPDDLDDRLAPDATRADRLALKLSALGYDRLWATAWSDVT